MLAFGQFSLLGADQIDAPFDQAPDVLLRRGMLPHAHVHGGRSEDRPAEREHRLSEGVVGEAVRELRERVRRERRNDEQVRLGEMRIEVARGLAARKRLERVRRDEALCVGSEDRRHLVSRFDEQTHELAGLVGRDAARDADENASHPAPFAASRG